MIRETSVPADQNPDYSTDPGNATTDKVFLLSITEAKNYFSTDNSCMCVPTAYAIANGAYTSSSNKVDGEGSCWWWLRSPGYCLDCAAGVNYDGTVRSGGSYVYNDDSAVRPALWVSLES